MLNVFQVRSLPNVGSQQASAVPMQSSVIPAQTTSLDLTEMMSLMITMMLMVMMIKMMTQAMSNI